MEEIISMSYGNGGKKTSKLIEEMFLPNFQSSELSELGDGALVKIKESIAFSTDSFVVNPYIFPGGDIGKLSICGTVNDLLMCGSIPKYISVALIIEEGFKIKYLERIIKSIGETARSAGVKVVTGDTKVVEKGHGHGIYINTAGIGERIDGSCFSKEKIIPGDKVIVTGSVGNHGISILCAREKLFGSSIVSDCRPLNKVAGVLTSYSDKVKIIRDPTRGGVATTLNEFVEGTNYSIEINEELVPVDKDVKTACDLLGVEALYSANEGKITAIVSEDAADEIINKLKKVEGCERAAVIGEVTAYMPSKVISRSVLGGRRILDKLSYDLLPRIC